MKRCLGERALILLSVGEGATEERDHCQTCAACAERLRGIVEDLGRIGEALSGVPPPLAAARRHRPSWGLAPAVAVAALVLIAGIGWLESHRALEPTATRPRGGVVTTSVAVEEVGAAVFGTSGERSLLALAGGGTSSVRASGGEGAEVDRALGLGSPCTAERFIGADCNDYTSALYF
jgi:hypothetical protein